MGRAPFLSSAIFVTGDIAAKVGGAARSLISAPSGVWTKAIPDIDRRPAIACDASRPRLFSNSGPAYANFARNTEDSHAPGPTKDQHPVEALAAYGDCASQDLGPSA